MNNQTAVQIQFGAGAIKALYEESLASQNIDIVCLSNNYTQVVGTYFDKDYAPRLFGSNIQTREILPDTKGNRKDALKKDGVKNQTKFMQIKSPSETDMLIFDNKAILISYNQESPLAVEINDLELVASFKNQFEALWKSLE